MTEKSDSDEWYTRKDLYLEICRMVKITPRLDVAATDRYHLCKYYFTKEDDALIKEWLIKACTKKTGIWMNPPNKQCAAFMTKALQQWKKHNINIICLIPSATISRRYFKEIWDTFRLSEGLLIDIIPIPRPNFLYKGQEGKGSARNDYMVVVFKKQHHV